MKRKKNYLYLGVFLVVIITSILKNYFITKEISNDWANDFYYVLLPDLESVSIIFLILAIISSSLWNPLKILFKILLISTFIFYIVDSIFLMKFDIRFNWIDIFHYVNELDVISSFIGIREIFIILVLILVLNIKIRVSKRQSIYLYVSSIIFFIVSWSVTIKYPVTLEHYSSSMFKLVLEPFLEDGNYQNIVEDYTKNDLEFYLSRYSSKQNFEVPKNKPNIVLVIIESLTASHSKSTSGLKNNLPLFDDLAKKGVLFRNFFANGKTSEVGITSLLSGSMPVTAPNGEVHPYSEFSYLDSAVRKYLMSNYHTEFLTTTPLSFSNLDLYLKNSGFNIYSGRDETESFKEAPRFSMKSPADDYLYKEALARIERLSKKEQSHLLVLVTASTHAPQIKPYGTKERVWTWAMQELQNFYNELEKEKFFDNGILLVTGDHHEMRASSEDAQKKYGDSEKARVPLLVIGADFKPGMVDDRFFQQSDLLSKLDSLNNRNIELSPYVFFREKSSWRINTGVDPGYITVFTSEDNGQVGYPLHVLGRNIKWLKEKPSQYRYIESLIHENRAFNYNYKQTKFK